MKTIVRGTLLTLLLLALAAPVLAAPVAQSGGDVHFGAYTLEVGQKATGDLVVFGGPVTMRVGSFLAGDLTVFGTVEMEREATLDGQLVVFGSADVSGAIEGDVFAVDGLALRSTAVVAGDVVVAGTLNQHPDAVVRGTVRPMRQGDWQWPGGIVLPRPLPDSGSTGDSGISTPRWVTFLWRVTRGIASVVIMALLALVIVSLWPTHLERVSRTIEEAPLLSFGVGLLALILSGLAAALLAITICLSPLALVGIIAVGVGLLMGWVALGLALGRRVFAGLAGRAPATIAVAALVGTTLVTALMAVSRVFGGLNALLVFLLVPPAAGAVLLTRFGSRPYATRGVVPTPSPTPRPVSAPLPRDTREAQLGADLNADVEVSGNPTITE